MSSGTYLIKIAFFCHFFHVVHILVSVSTRRIPSSRSSVLIFAINGHQDNERSHVAWSHARCRDSHGISVKVCSEVNWESNCKEEMKSRRHTEMDWDQQLNFYYFDPVNRLIGQPKFAGKK